MASVQLLIVLGAVSYIAMETTLPRFTINYGHIYLRPEQSPLASVQADSVVTCAISCHNHNTPCSMAIYRDASGECVLYHWIAVGSVGIQRESTETYPTQLIIRHETSHILVGELLAWYNIAYSGAPGFCARVGGRVASMPELTAARDLGWDACNCGWLDDGRAYYWTFRHHTTDALCTATADQPFHCTFNPQTMYNVHCTIE